MDEPIYLNHAGTSWPTPTCVSDAVVDAMRSHPAEWPSRFERAHAAVCRFFGVADSEQLLLTPGCTSSLVTAIASVDLPAGSRVLTSCWEHHAVYGPLQKLTEKGVAVDVVPASDESPMDLDALEQSLAAGEVGLVAVTAACNVTGDLLPIEAIIELAHRYDAMVLIDAAQIVGWVDLQLDELGADMVAFGGHKGLQAPWGIGGLYVAASARLKCATAQCSIIGRSIPDKNAGASGQQWGSRPGYCDVGSVDQFSLAGLAASLDRLGDTTRLHDLEVAREQARRLRETLSRNERVTLFGIEDGDRRLPTIAFAVADETSDQSAERLRQHGLIVGSGLQCSPVSHEALRTSETGLVRISAAVRQPESEIVIANERLAVFCSGSC
ncbi:Cysteine desulfurase [Rubripirellula obstinata]|uniref:Cysteine desulfurase n=1 Tax=Rubripirellula obstinata TaxID=406547 RepID=A0A5B1CDQ2_9BACT|nr:aminotransferase class V-fold PLP-dependent enzyme [Rubripirellula obstinata]KAA1257995.1 Cysteine desulfurase [Rubripirellula obstinata]